MKTFVSCDFLPDGKIDVMSLRDVELKEDVWYPMPFPLKCSGSGHYYTILPDTEPGQQIWERLSDGTVRLKYWLRQPGTVVAWCIRSFPGNYEI